MHPKDADGMANSIDPDQTALEEQSDLDRHCLPRPFLSENLGSLRYFYLSQAFNILLKDNYKVGK